MNITPKIDYVEGSFDTKDCQMVCVPRWKYGTVHLCIKTENGWNVPVGEIQLYDSDLMKDAMATFEDASAFGEEIARRWNECNSKK